jgi:hypothetical protein
MDRRPPRGGTAPWYRDGELVVCPIGMRRTYAPRASFASPAPRGGYVVAARPPASGAPASISRRAAGLVRPAARPRIGRVALRPGPGRRRPRPRRIVAADDPRSTSSPQLRRARAMPRGAARAAGRQDHQPYRSPSYVPTVCDSCVAAATGLASYVATLRTHEPQDRSVAALSGGRTSRGDARTGRPSSAPVPQASRAHRGRRRWH